MQRRSRWYPVWKVIFGGCARHLPETRIGEVLIVQRTWITVIVFLTLGLPQSIKADGVLVSWSGSDVQGVSPEAFEAAKRLPADDIAQKNLLARSWGDAYLLMVAAMQHKTEKPLQEKLAAQIADKTQVSLKGTNRLIVWERITTGEILFEGKGFHVADDLFSVAGRANWMLRNLTSKNFGYVKPASSDTDLNNLQKKWQQWLKGENVQEYQAPHKTQKGLEEIKSFEALEALIASLRGSDEKDRVTNACLKRLYNLDKLPDDAASPAMLCSPDNYTHRYLTILTGQDGRHDYNWWKEWWGKNKDRLKWNPETDKFDTKSP